ncbi:MAG TPA: Swt1 family HEPN domain-containing protein [Solirubrobacteraceae bacterium]|nr:Swt1 family HEPN domain-containing protein [Solirubrobacteraceae bacterium]
MDGTKALNAVKLFAATSQLIEHDLDEIEAELGLDLRRGHRAVVDAAEAHYPQIESSIRAEAARMAPHYEVFYSLETTIRRFISDSLEAAESSAWWTSPRVPTQIQAEAQARQAREVDSGVTPRSDDPLDYTTFGELGEIIKANWDVFGATFSSPKAVARVMANLNTLRGPIAHCSPLAEDEIVRLRLAVRDWFRLMQ